MDYTDPSYHPQLKQLAATIDQLDYYEILNLQQDASTAQLKESYFSQSRALHPDRFYHLPDEELKTAIHKIYKRITEAYVILKDPQKRAKYTADVNGPQRQEKLRFNEAAEEEAKKEQEEAREVCKTPKGRKLWRTVEQDLRDEKWDAAYRNLQSISLWEPGNPTIAELKATVDKKRKGLTK
ncbi:MAG: DnaJ domain-containing protein [Deltaproteobacteria bacterium]|nr:DnaJ domain-containing protein [Deltaproteobacteria bacterium]